MTTIAIQSTAPTAITVSIAGVPAGFPYVEIQYSHRIGFDWSLAPIARFQTAATVQLAGVNQLSRYFLRARAISNTGTPGEWSPTIGAFTQQGAARLFPADGILNAPTIIVPLEQVLDWRCSSEVAGYPARALGRDDPISSLWVRLAQGQYAFRATTAGSPIDTIALLASNASDDCTVTIKAGPTDANVNGSAPAFMIGPLPFRASPSLPQRPAYHGLIRLTDPVTQPVWRIEVRGTVPGDLLVMTYAVFGLARQTRNFAADKSEVSTDSGSIARDRSGVANRVDGYRARTVELELAYMNERQYETQMSDIAGLVGATDPVLVVPNSKPGPFLHDRILFGQLKPIRVVNTSVPWFTAGISVDSLI